MSKPVQIRKTTFDHLDAVELKTNRLRMVIVTAIGPRVAHLSAIRGRIETRNLLFWDSPKKYRRGEWILRGGHRIWGTRPLADESEEAYAEDNAPCQVQEKKNEIVVIGPELREFGVRKILSVRVLDATTLEVRNSITNTGSLLWSGGVWALTATQPTRSCTYGIPLGDGGSWDSFAVVIPKTWGGHTTLVNDPQITFTEHCLIFRPKGRESKRMVQAPRGLIGMTDQAEKVTFLKYSPYDPDARYPMNCNLAFYNGPGSFMTEIESMGAERTLKPGETASNVETWAMVAPVNWKKVERFSLS